MKEKDRGNLITLQDYIHTVGCERIGIMCGVGTSTVYAWGRMLSVPNYKQAIKLIDTSNGVLSWHTIYEPYRTKAFK